MASSVDCNCKFSERILSTPAISKATSKLFGLRGCSDDKNWLDFVIINVIIITDFSSIFFKICRFRNSFLLSGEEKSRTSERALSLVLDFSSPEFFLAPLDFFPPPLTAPGSPRMSLHGKPLKSSLTVIFLDQSKFLITHSNQWDCFILYRQQIASYSFFCVRQSGQRPAFE